MNSPDSNKVEKFLEDQLKNWSEGTQAPSELKDEVFNTLDTLSLLGDVADLFTMKFSQSEAILWKNISDGVMEDMEEEEDSEKSK